MALLIFVAFAFLGLLAWAGMPWQFLLIFAIGMSVFQYFMSDKLVLLSTGAKVVSAQEEPWLHATIERLSAMADIPKPKKIAIMETHVPNAFATGRNPKNSVVAVTRGLLNRLDPSEVEAVLGHELAHVKNRDVMVMTWASVIVIFAGYLLNMLGWIALFGGFGGGFGGGNDRRDAGQFFLVIMAVYIGTIVIYFLSQMLIMALSRYREFAADRSGSIITGAPLQLASALAKISNDMYRIPEKDLRQVEHASAFFIIPALKGNDLARLFSSHPPVEQRIERLRNMQSQMNRRM
jgi:heat shock protein HtpX